MFTLLYTFILSCCPPTPPTQISRNVKKRKEREKKKSNKNREMRLKLCWQFGVHEPNKRVFSIAALLCAMTRISIEVSYKCGPCSSSWAMTMTCNTSEKWKWDSLLFVIGSSFSSLQLIALWIWFTWYTGWPDNVQSFDSTLSTYQPRIFLIFVSDIFG